MYKRTVNKDGQQPPRGDGGAASSESGSAGPKGDDVVDADFEEVK